MKKQPKAALKNEEDTNRVNFMIHHHKYGDLVVVVDKEDWPDVQKYHWLYAPASKGHDAYVYTNILSTTGKTRRVKLQDFIMSKMLYKEKNIKEKENAHGQDKASKTRKTRKSKAAIKK